MKLQLRIAELSDAARELPGGEELARELLTLAEQVQTSISQQVERYRKAGQAAIVKALELNNETLQETGAYHQEQLEAERNRIARLIASDERWRGSFADAVRLVTPKE
jgi:hypothetical protein